MNVTVNTVIVLFPVLHVVHYHNTTVLLLVVRHPLLKYLLLVKVVIHNCMRVDFAHSWNGAKLECKFFVPKF